MFIYKLKQELEKTRNKDIKFIKKSTRRLKGCTDEDKKFCKKVKDVHAVVESRVFEICEVLACLIDNPVSEAMFERPFSKACVISVLKDEEFTAFMMVSNLFMRTLNLSYKSKGEFKIRLYVAILNFDEYQKSRWCD